MGTMVSELLDLAEGLAPRSEPVAGGLGLLEGLVMVSGVNLTLLRDREEREDGPAGLGSGLGAGLLWKPRRAMLLGSV